MVEALREEKRMILKLVLCLTLAIAMVNSEVAMAADEDPNTKKPKTIAIIGNSELPRVDVDLAWRIASDRDATKIELVAEQMPDVLRPIDVEEHRKRVYFDKHIKVQTDAFTN